MGCIGELSKLKVELNRKLETPTLETVLKSTSLTFVFVFALVHEHKLQPGPIRFTLAQTGSLQWSTTR